MCIRIISFAEDDNRFRRERSFRNGLTAEAAERAWIIRTLWKAFPEASSEDDLAKQVAKHLSTESRTIQARTVRYWLRGDTTPHFRYMVPILALAGAEAVMDMVFGKDR